ncbi:MAG TPA: sigma factor-like helix-turn-helix DNA-binding protein, partial [Burkholderiaceae bacterium]|nr:sigma factor-like helix-turn-helix DNA-binding protein [Burkholderiaceae bacterium]
MSYKDYISERNQMIYDMRVVDGRTFTSIAKELGVGMERIRQIVAKVERCKLHKDRRDAAPRGSLGSMRLTTRLEG